MIHFIVPKDPLLRWSMINSALHKKFLPSCLIKKPTLFFSRARNAIYHSLRALNLSSGDNILVPSFHCNTAIEPILKYGAKVKFYDIRRDCSPDFSDIEAKIDGKTRALLAIHYFGFSQDIEKLKKICTSHGLYLIEDCAHVLTGKFNGQTLGTFGDVSIYSWRKFFPLYDGGQLVINNSKYHVEIPWQATSKLYRLKIAKNIFDKLIDDSSGKIFKHIARFSKIVTSASRSLISMNTRQNIAFKANQYDQDFDISLVNLKMSNISYYILRSMDIPAIVEKRRLNYSTLSQKMESLKCISPFFSNLPEGVCPWVFPVLAPGKKDFHLALRAKGIPAFTWGGVVHRKLLIEKFPDADFLYKNLILLPLHQSIGDAEIKTMIETIRVI